MRASSIQGLRVKNANVAGEGSSCFYRGYVVRRGLCIRLEGVGEADMSHVVLWLKGGCACRATQDCPCGKHSICRDTQTRGYSLRGTINHIEKRSGISKHLRMQYIVESVCGIDTNLC